MPATKDFVSVLAECVALEADDPDYALKLEVIRNSISTGLVGLLELVS